MKQTTEEREWITPLEAALEMSMRSGKMIFPDDIKQMRLNKRLDKNAVLHISHQLSLYDREYIATQAPIPSKRTEAEEARCYKLIASWLEANPGTLARLQEQGYRLYNDAEKHTNALEQSHIVLEQRRRKRENHQGGRHLKKL